MSKRADRAAKNDGEQPLKLGIVEIAALFLNLLANPTVAALIAACKKKPPEPPPVPAELVAEGITPETWKQANDSKFASENSVAKNKKGFHAGVVNQVAIQIAQEKGVKKKAAKPTAISALQSGLDEPVEEIARAMQHAKDNKAAILAEFTASHP